MKKKVFALLMAAVLLVGISVGGTVAWLTAKTEDVVNTFSVGNIELDIWENALNEDGTLNTSAEPVKTNVYQFVPGDTLRKNPWVEVKAESEACYLFVKVTATHNDVDAIEGEHEALSTIIQYKVDEYDVTTNPTGIWKPVENHAGYWYCVIDAATAKAGTELSILAPKNTAIDDDNIMINTGVTKAMVETIKATPPTLTFTAAAVQKDNIADVATAWEQLPDEFTGETP